MKQQATDCKTNTCKTHISLTTFKYAKSLKNQQ